MSGSRRIRLDVGGRVFATSLDTLTATKGNYFEVMFNGRIQPTLESDGTYFIDRNPSVFDHVLDFLRGYPPKIKLLSPLERYQLLNDAQFYLLDDLVKLLSVQTWRWKSGPHYVVTNDGLSVMKMGKNQWDTTVVCEKSLQTMYGGEYNWNFRIDRGEYTMIGIACSSIDQTQQKNYSFPHGWFLSISDGCLYEKGKPLHSIKKIDAGQIVKIIVDLFHGSILFYVDDALFWERFFDVDQYEELTPAVLFYESQSGVTLV